MIRLILLGLLAAAFFSATFILNRSMSLSGGHWVWSSSLRFFYMFFLLVGLILVNRGVNYLRDVITIFIRNAKFWLIAGSIGFGIFYSLLCYAADHAPGWVVAGTWQFTVIATPIVLLLFKKKSPSIWYSFLFFNLYWYFSDPIL
jgi:drug/metabolite transporter (DMT)-like permease